MRQIKITELTEENFKIYGTFSNMINPAWEKLGQEPCEFYRDMNVLPLGQNTSVSFSVTRACERPKIVNELEFHRTTGEGMLPIDGDVIMQVAPACKEEYPDMSKVQAFRIPKGMMVTVRPGVWHAGCFTDGCDVCNMLIALPERTYADDCYIAKIKDEDLVEIVD